MVILLIDTPYDPTLKLFLLDYIADEILHFKWNNQLKITNVHMLNYKIIRVTNLSRSHVRINFENHYFV